MKPSFDIHSSSCNHSQLLIILIDKMVQSASLGFPRIGANRDLKFLIEKYWAGKVDVNALEEGAKVRFPSPISSYH
jgi:hypothetical protein